jgi:hypothetical protein
MVTNILKHCDELLAISNYPTSDVLVYEGLKGEMYLSARYQLDRLGVASKLLSNSLHCEPLELPDIENVQGLDLTIAGEFRLQISNDNLLQIMKSKATFDAAYERISQKCFRSFEICQRPGTVSFLKADLAFLHFARQNYTKAAEIFEEICFKYSEHGWNHIDTVLIERYAISQRQLKRTKNLVRAYLHLVQFPTHLILETADHYLHQLKLSCQEVDIGYQARNNPLLEIIDLEVVDELNIGCPLRAEITIFSAIIKEFQFDHMSLSFAAGDGAHMIFEMGDITLQPGSNKFKVAAKVFMCNLA